MIVTTFADTVGLSGALVKNQWLTIKAAASLLLREHPEGIVIDCGELTNVSEDGSKTFLEAVKDIQAGGSRIVVCNLPRQVLELIKTVPGVRSQLPIASSVEEARASFKLTLSAPPTDSDRPAAENGVVVPLMDGLDPVHAVRIAARAAFGTNSPIHLVYLLEVGRSVALGTPMPEREAAANAMLDAATVAARELGVAVSAHVERVRDAQEGALAAIKNYKAGYAVLCVTPAAALEDRWSEFASILLHKAQCDVLIGRAAITSHA